MGQTERIVIVVDDRVGVLADITSVLAGAGINIESMDAEVSGQRGAIIMTVNETDHALSLLNQAGYRAVGEDTVVIRLRDEPGSLARVADRLKQAEVNIQNLHILGRQDGISLIALTTSDRAATETALREEEIL